MSFQHRQIPVLQESPRIRPLSGHIIRSYPVGRQSFSRACQGEVLTLTITTEHPIPDNIQAKLVTRMNSNDGKTWNTVPFTRDNERSLVCHITPKHPGLHSFRAEFSMDQGISWLRDTLPDAWILVDPPQVDGLRIYTLIPTVSGTVADWKEDFKRIREMGFNAIHLLPITAMDSSESPYAAKDLFDIDPSYLVKGSKQDGLAQLEEFIEEAKTTGIRLCFDIVLNHVGIHSKMAKRAPGWIVPDPNQPDGFQRARYWSGHGWLTWNDLILINYEHPSETIRAEIWSYMTDYALFWANYANETGGFVRFDNLHSSDPDFVQALTKALHSEYPNVGILAEYFTDETTLLHTGPKWGLNLNLATPWDYKFVPQLREYLIYIHRVSKHVRYFMPVTSHDSGSPAQEFGSVESTIPRYVAAALLGTGATGIIQGVEYGLMEKIKFIGRKPKMQYTTEPRFAGFIGQINAILTGNQAFRHGNNCLFVDNGHPAILAAYRSDIETQKFGFLVVCNFDIHTSQLIVIDLTTVIGTDGPFSCYELLSDKTLLFEKPVMEFMLQPCSAQVLKIRRNLF
jgi:hypothetical protein